MLYIPTVNRDGNLFDGLIERWWAWRSRQTALGTCGRDEVARIAHDLALSSGELRALARKGANSADLLYRRMADLGIDRAGVARGDGRIVWDMQRSCSMCASKRRCRRDFARGADASAWRDYCPNDEVLSSFAPAHQVGPAGGRSAARTTTIEAEDHGRTNLFIGLALLALALLVLLSSPASGPYLAIPTPPIATEAAAPPAVSCLDTSSLTAPQQMALHALRTVQTQGWLASSTAEITSAQEAAATAQAVSAGEALACTRQGGTPYYGLMFRDGCAGGLNAGVRAEGYQVCRPMAGGGGCLLR